MLNINICGDCDERNAFLGNARLVHSDVPGLASGREPGQAKPGRSNGPGRLLAWPGF